MSERARERPRKRDRRTAEAASSSARPHELFLVSLVQFRDRRTAAAVSFSATPHEHVMCASPGALKASFSFHSTECSTTSHIPDLISVSGSCHQGNDPCPLLLQCQHKESPLGASQSVTLTVAPPFVPGVRRASRHGISSHLCQG